MSQRPREQPTADAAPEAAGRVGFGPFELDLETGELRREGRFVPLQSQAARVLVHLVARAGHLVPRGQLIDLLWPDSIVEYDQGLNGIVRDLRSVLGDDAQAPRFIETLPRQGYRFIAAVAPIAAPGDGEPRVRAAAPAPALSPRARWPPALPAALSAVAVLVAAVSLWLSLRPAGGPAGEAPIIAVLPFSGDDAEARRLGASLAGELVHELVAVPAASLRIIGEASAAAASAASGDPSRAGALSAAASLGATHVVTGSVDPAADRVALAVTLLRVSDRKVLLTERAEPSWNELLGAQRRIARRLAGRVTGRIAPRSGKSAALPSEVLEDYLYGRYLLVKGSPEATEEAVARLRAVVAAAPRFGSGRVALGEALLASGEAATAEAQRQAREALRLDPRDARAHLLRARLALTDEWDWELAERHLDRAGELAPGDPMTHLGRAAYAASLGRHDEALTAVSVAKRLDPLSATVQGDLAMFHYWAGDREGVLAETALLLEREPEHRFAKSLRLRALLDAGRWEEARAVAVSLTGDEASFAGARDAEIERRFLEIQEARWRAAPSGALRSIVLASMAARRGDRKAAVDHLEDARRRRCSYVPFLPVDPDFRLLSADASFRRLLADVGHPLAHAGAAPGGELVGKTIGSG